MRYLLDINICIYLIKEKPEVVFHRLSKALASGVGISLIALSELEYGVQKSSYVEQNALSLLRFLAPFEIVSYDDAAAREYGILRVALEKKEQAIGGMDMLLGAHAKAGGRGHSHDQQRTGIQLDRWARC
jgi:tRNA(fMet)-specific endonuclease VapC